MTKKPNPFRWFDSSPEVAGGEEGHFSVLLNHADDILRALAPAPSPRNVLCGWLPHCKGSADVGDWVGCGLVSGLFARSWTAGPDGLRWRGPILLCGL